MVWHGGVDLGTGEALIARVRRGLSGDEVFPSQPNHRIAADFLTEAHDRSAPGDAAAIADAAAALLLDDEPIVRAGAIRFFQSSNARRPDPLRQAMQDDQGRFEGVADPLPGATGDLRHELARAAARRLPMDTALRDTIRAEALRSGRARTVVAALGWHDAEWLRAHALDIGAGSPDSLDPLLYSLKSGGANIGLLVPALRTRVPSPALRAAIESVFSGDERDALLALL